MVSLLAVADEFGCTPLNGGGVLVAVPAAIKCRLLASERVGAQIRRRVGLPAGRGGRGGLGLPLGCLVAEILEARPWLFGLPNRKRPTWVMRGARTTQPERLRKYRIRVAWR